MHHHTELDVQPGTVTLCLVHGQRWFHVPVDHALWRAPELRPALLAKARQLTGVGENDLAEVVHPPLLTGP